MKTCELCGTAYAKPDNVREKQWQHSTTCSRACAGEKGRRNRVRPSVAERFWSKVDKRTGQGPHGDCWCWTGHTMKWGYGAFRADGKIRKSHRMAFSLTHGEPPAAKLVRHSCDNPPCCNPAHLSLGTTKSNMADMIARGRKRNRGMGRLPRVDPHDPDSMPIPGDFSK